MISTDALAVLISFTVLVLATGLFFGLKRYAGGVDSAVFVALLLTPLLLYLSLSGRLQEFSGPGGWGAKFRDIAHDSVTRKPMSPNGRSPPSFRSFMKRSSLNAANTCLPSALPWTCLVLQSENTT